MHSSYHKIIKCVGFKPIIVLLAWLLTWMSRHLLKFLANLITCFYRMYGKFESIKLFFFKKKFIIINLLFSILIR